MKAAEAIGERLLSRVEVEEWLQCSTSALYSAIKSGRLPQPIRITPGQPRWPASAIRAVLDAAKKKAGYAVEGES